MMFKFPDAYINQQASMCIRRGVYAEKTAKQVLCLIYTLKLENTTLM